MRALPCALLVLLTSLTTCRFTTNVAPPTATPLATLPTAHVIAAKSAPPIVATAPPVVATAPPVVVTAPSAAHPLTTQEQYRAWMEEARGRHPYDEPVDRMWALMLCESSGQPDSVSGQYYGLFQYQPETWAGDWNPYRDQPILDPHAQIFATAKAWQDGNQYWWGCY